MTAPNSQVSIVSLGGGTPMKMGTTATDSIGFFTTTLVSQRTSAAQSALTLTTLIAGTSLVGFQTSAGFNALFAQVQEIAATLTALGLWHGS